LADVDAERDKLLHDFQGIDAPHGGPLEINWIDDFQPVREGRNGGGDHFATDGRLAVVESPEAMPTP
jgi:hypothetical protein